MRRIPQLIPHSISCRRRRSVGCRGTTNAAARPLTAELLSISGDGTIVDNVATLYVAATSTALSVQLARPQLRSNLRSAEQG